MTLFIISGVASIQSTSMIILFQRTVCFLLYWYRPMVMIHTFVAPYLLWIQFSLNRMSDHSNLTFNNYKQNPIFNFFPFHSHPLWILKLDRWMFRVTISQGWYFSNTMICPNHIWLIICTEHHSHSIDNLLSWNQLIHWHWSCFIEFIGGWIN